MRRCLVVGYLLTATVSSAWITRTCPSNASLRPSYSPNTMWPFVFLANMPAGNTWRQSVQNQMFQWNSIVGASDVMTVVSGSSSACVQGSGVTRTTIGWDDGTCTSWGATTLGITSVTTQNCAIVRQEVYFNSNATFSTGLFIDTALHELGHAAGAGHEWNDVAIMGYSGEPLLALTADDHAFLRTIWPSGQTAAPDLYVTRMVLRNPVIPNVESMVLSPAPTCSNGCTNLRAGDTISVRLTYGNAGSRSVSGALPIEMRLGSQVVGTWTLSNYPAHGQDTFTFIATVPTGIPPGNYSLTVEMDPAGTISQSSGPAPPDFVSFPGFSVRLPAGWTCASTRYGSGDGCDCACGAVDPDCSSSSIAVRGCGDVNLCTDDRCNASGQCSYVNNTLSCDDGLFCTTNDRCSNGSCAASLPRDCSSLTGSCTTGSCDETANACVRTPRNEAGTCSDGLFCTVNDVCTAGQCVGVPRDCSSLTGACSTGSCNELTDQCVATPTNEGTSCNDTSVCTITDVCRSGTCVGQPLDCSSLTQGCVRGVCDAMTGQCTTAPLADGSSCEDGAFCTAQDSCRAGVCQPGPPRTCPSTTCASGVCDEALNVCGTAPINEGGTCDDGQFCTVNEVCTTGQCVGASRNCSSLGGACTTGTCNESTDRCVATPTNEGMTCDDGSPCTTTDVCRSGACSGRAVDCSSLTGGCGRGVCDPMTGQCVSAPVADGTSCSDGAFCTVQDTCRAGVCQPGPSRSCPSTSCATGVCDEAQDTCGAMPTNEGGACNDGRFCTSQDACRSGACVGSVPTDCSSLDSACRQGQCDEALGACRAVNAREGQSCDDTNGCSERDVCVAGTCRGSPKACSTPATACEVGFCDAATGQCATRPRVDGSSCSDGLRCTVNDSCRNGVCGGRPVDCSSFATTCNPSACEETTGQCATTRAPDGTTCSDLTPCTTNDACVAGRCVGQPVACTAPANSCLVALCDPLTGRCSTVPAGDGTACDDGQACTRLDVCRAGVCGGTPTICSSTPSCPSSCEPSTGQCVSSVPGCDAPRPSCSCGTMDGVGLLALLALATRRRRRAPPRAPVKHGAQALERAEAAPERDGFRAVHRIGLR
ncbi:MAG: CARDB domain-containing protein [Myxococcales bacterium]|nr:CARDB domain-containing protein [Myxococcales bacterium]